MIVQLGDSAFFAYDQGAWSTFSNQIERLWMIQFFLYNKLFMTCCMNEVNQI